MCRRDQTHCQLLCSTSLSQIQNRRSDNWRWFFINAIKVACVYSEKKNLASRRRDRPPHYFFMHALCRNKKLDVDYVPAEHKVDVSSLHKDHDVVLIAHFEPAVVAALSGIENSSIPVIAFMLVIRTELKNTTCLHITKNTTCLHITKSSKSIIVLTSMHLVPFTSIIQNTTSMKPFLLV